MSEYAELMEQLRLRASRACADGYANPFDVDLDNEAAAAIERLMAERDADEARVTLLEGSLRKAAERLEARGHHFGAERARAALTALPQVPQSTASPDDQEGEKT